MVTIGNYEIIEELGRGAMGVVFRALDRTIGRSVAVKVIRSQPFPSPEESEILRLRFAREAAAAGMLSHANIVTVYHFGEERDYQRSKTHASVSSIPKCSNAKARIRRTA